jgi:hypothetical protein
VRGCDFFFGAHSLLPINLGDEIPEASLASLPIDIGDEYIRSSGASLPMIDLGARAYNSG